MLIAVEEKPVLLTEQGLKKIEERLEYLKKVKRQEIAERIRQAKALGDLSENSEYQQAKEEQGIVEGEIMTLEATLRRAQIIQARPRSDGYVGIGSKVTVRYEDGFEEEYVIVVPAEADPSSGKISLESPLGSALMDHKAGDIVTYQAPSGLIRVEIVEVA